MQDEPLSDFDPYEWMMDMSNILNELTIKHNDLTNDYLASKKRLKMLEKQLIEIQMQLLSKDF